jgi:hypothetical protein
MTDLTPRPSARCLCGARAKDHPIPKKTPYASTTRDVVAFIRKTWGSLVPGCTGCYRNRDVRG